MAKTLICITIAFSLLISCEKVGNNEPEVAGDNMHVDDFSVTEVKYNGKSCVEGWWPQKWNYAFARLQVLQGE